MNKLLEIGGLQLLVKPNSVLNLMVSLKVSK